MAIDHRAELTGITSFPSLVRYLRDELGWPIEGSDFEELTFDYTPEELGIDGANAAKIQEIKRLRPLTPNQPWGIFFVKFEPKKLPVVALRRILGRVVVKKRASANSADRVAWAADDLLFISSFGAGDQRQISVAHFSQETAKSDLPVLKVLGWDNLDSPLHLDHVAELLSQHLAWPEDDQEADEWRQQWRSAFTLRYREVITTSKLLAERLAKLARAIRDRIETALAIESEHGPLTKLLETFREALVHDLDREGFADMYAQTIAYGLLSARITDPRSDTVDDFAQHMRTSPFLRELMETFLSAGRQKASGAAIDFDELGVSDVIELLDAANMEAVLRDFGDRNPQQDPVIHFYELFLKEYDAKKRMQRGVFYTPRPVVSYIVGSIDELLRTEFGLEDGLADTAAWGEIAAHHAALRVPDGVDPSQAFVQILDPATGTGTFLVEVIDVIHRTLAEKWRAQGQSEEKIELLWNEYVPKHLLPRLHGYELLMAPYAIAHLKIGLKLYETGYRFGSGERARIYLTNALEPPTDFSDRLEFTVPALAREATSVNRVKEDGHFTVILGNPPYAIHSGSLSEAARATIDRYREFRGDRIRERGALQFEKNLQNDYVKFIRLAECAIADAGAGVQGYITSHAFLSNRTLRGMRESLLQNFSALRFLNLHGNAASGEAAALAAGDENVFEITEGVAVSICSRAPSAEGTRVLYKDVAGPRSMKYKFLAGSQSSTTEWDPLSPRLPNLILKPAVEEALEFESGVPLDEVFVQHSAGVITARDAFATDRNREALVARVQAFANSSLSGAELRDAFSIKDKKGWDVDVAQKQARDAMPLGNVVLPYLYRPFASRYIAYCRGIVWGMAYPTLKHTLKGDNRILLSMQQYQYDVPEYCYVFCSAGLTDSRIFVSKTGVAVLFPLYLRHEAGMLDADSGRSANVTRAFRDQLCDAVSLEWVEEGAGDLEADGTLGPEDVFSYIYGLLHSGEYRRRFAEPLKSGFPRVLLPAGLSILEELVRVGRRLEEIHLGGADSLDASPITFDGPLGAEVQRVGWANGTVWIDAGKAPRKGPAEPGTVGFKGVKREVWEYFIGGYQVLDKWLKDRKGQKLTEEEINQYRWIAAALAETIELSAEADEAINRHGGWTDAFGPRKA